MEIKTNREDLEKALGSAKIEKPEEPSKQLPQISKEEEVGFHKGAINTLAAERNELVKMVQNVEMIMQAHIKRLEELGVKIDTESKN